MEDKEFLDAVKAAIKEKVNFSNKDGMASAGWGEGSEAVKKAIKRPDKGIVFNDIPVGTVFIVQASRLKYTKIEEKTIQRTYFEYLHDGKTFYSLDKKETYTGVVIHKDVVVNAVKDNGVEEFVGRQDFVEVV